MAITVVLVALVIMVSLIWKMIWRRPRGAPPGPGFALPLIGHLHLLSEDVRPKFRDWRDKYGDIFSLYIGNQIMVVLNGCEVIKDALVKHADVFSDRPVPEILKQMTTAEGLGDSSGRAWTVQRKIVAELLRRFGTRKNMEGIVRGEMVEFIKELRATNCQSFDSFSLVHVAICNTVSTLLFSKRYSYHDQDAQTLVFEVSELMQIMGSGSVTVALPFLGYLPGNVHIVKRVQDIYRRIVKIAVMPNIEKHVKEQDKERCPNNFVSAYLKEVRQAADKGTADIINEGSLQNVLVDLHLAGMDSVSTTLRWALVFLINHPEVQEKCHQDIVKTIGTSKMVELSDKAKLPYVQATMMEVLRLSEIASIGVVHCTAKDTNFRGFYIPKGALIVPNLDSMLHDPKIWSEPEMFRPDRFLDADGNVIRPGEFLPFSIGIRSCVGESLARLVFFMFLTTIIQHFRFLPAEDGCLPSFKGIHGLVHSPKPFSLRAVPRD